MKNEKGWALILGVSSGFGGASAIELARAGLDIFGVHLDRRTTLKNAEEIVSKIKDLGREAIFFNQNAADIEKKKMILDEIEAKITATPGSSIRTLIHSLAFGTLKPYISPSSDNINKAQMEMTADVMANSLVYWTQ
ncbi:MAG: SDR family NAD(P)-dependent oxidoreductase, partial [Nitrospirota bacterium]